MGQPLSVAGGWGEFGVSFSWWMGFAVSDGWEGLFIFVYAHEDSSYPPPPEKNSAVGISMKFPQFSAIFRNSHSFRNSAVFCNFSQAQTSDINPPQGKTLLGS